MNGGEKCNRSSHQHRHPAYGGLPRIDDRRAYAAMIYVLRTGIQWNALPDVRLLCATLDGIVIMRPEPTEEHPQHLCLDAGYDGAPSRQEVESRHYMPHIRSRGQEKQEKIRVPGHRAPVGSWCALEKKVENYLAFLHLACAKLIFAKLAVFG